MKVRQVRGSNASIDYGVGTTETMRRFGGIGITLECGQHEDDAAPHVAYQAILNSLAHLGMLSDAVAPAPIEGVRPFASIRWLINCIQKTTSVRNGRALKAFGGVNSLLVVKTVQN